MNEYKASNGVEIRDDGSVLKWRTTTYPIWEPVGSGVPDMAGPGFARDSLIGRALAEFFQHERDEQLGRWRWPENPDYVVYPSVREGCYGHGRGVQLLDERTGRLYDKWESSAASLVDESEPNRVARAYFAAHPEPKPWDDAKPGQVWVVHVTGDRNPFAARKDYEGLWRSVHNDSHIPKQFIEHARRIWPEAS